MITGIESHAHADGTFEIRATFDDGDEAMGLFLGMSRRMADQATAAPGRALSVAALEALVEIHGSSAAVRDRDGDLWRWNGVSWRGRADGMAVEGNHGYLFEQRSPLREA